MNEFLVVGFTDQRSPLLRDARGRFISAQSQLTSNNRSAADHIQRLVVRNISRSIKRKRVSSDRLITVTGSEQNRGPVNGSYTQGYFVGDPEYLDQSQAKYWRTIEEGSEATWKKRSIIGLQVYGLWGESILGIGESEKWGSRVLAGPPFTKPGANRQGKIVPKAAVRAHAAATGEKTPKIAKITVKRQIQGQHAYSAAWRQYGGGTRIRRDLRTLLEALSGKGNWQL